MNRLQALGILVALAEAGEVSLPECTQPGNDGGPLFDVGAEFQVALADVSGRLPECRTADELRDAAAAGGWMYQSGEVSAAQVEAAMKAVVDDVNRFGEQVDLESN